MSAVSSEGAASPPPDVVGERVELDRVDWLWVNDWYDGPLSGVVLVNGERFFAQWADCLGEGDVDRVYQLWDLTPEAWAAEVERHEWFCQHVGRYYDYRTDDRSYRPASEHAKYYDRYPPGEYRPPDGRPCGWFVD